MTLLLLLACTQPSPSVPNDTDTVLVDDTDPADTDTPDTDRVGEVLQPAPGVFIDRASPTWFDVAAQSLVCWLVIAPGDTHATIDLLGMDSGTLHPYVTGLRLPEDAGPALFDANLDLADGVLYITRYRLVTALVVEDARWLPNRPIDGDQFATFGGEFTDGHATWQTWDAVGGPSDTLVGGRIPYDVASDGDALYVRDTCGLRRIRGDVDLPECFTLPMERARGYIAADVVGLHSVMMWQKDRAWWVSKSDGNGRVLAEYELPAGYFHNVQGVACQPGPL